MNYIKNYNDLVDHGFKKERQVALDCMNVALEAANTYQGTKNQISLSGSQLKAGNSIYDLNSIRNLYVVGAGKGSYPIACALDEILGARITDGIVAVKDPSAKQLINIRVLSTSHPVPDEDSLKAGEAIRDLSDNLQENDLVITCLTGGCSALMVLPVDGVSLADKKIVNKLLLSTGAPIYELNAVRKHISRIKGGNLLKMLQPAKVITLTQDTTPEFLPWPDPVLPDPSTFKDAISVLEKYEIWEQTPTAVKKYLLHGLENPELETPKDTQGFDHIILDTGNQRDACLAATEYARSMGYNAFILSTRIEGESKDVGSVLAGVAKEIQLDGRPFEAPCVLLSAGETRVALNSVNGEGGPNQELALGFAMNIEGYDNITLISIDSEGTDGPTDIAGGLTDSTTISRAKEKGIDIFEYLRKHDSSNALRKINDAVMTGPTGTNVVNLRVLVIGEKENK